MLRDFQHDLISRIFAAWREPNVFNVLAVAPTGSGKTVIFCDVIKKMNAPTCVIAHRQELLSQAALSLNREHVRHCVIAPKAVISQIIALEHQTHGYSEYEYQSTVRVAGVNALVRKDVADDRWFSQVQLIIQDEAHHVLRENIFGRAHSMFPNARSLGVTAHAVRADGCSLGRSGDGLVDSLVVGPSARELINRGYLTDYDIACPKSDIDFSNVTIGATGDYSLPKLRAATHGSNRIVGDVVRKYLELAPGKLGITFAVDIESAKNLAATYKKNNIPAEVITANTPIAQRAQFMRLFRERRLLQLVSVDCLGEGTDVPSIEVVSFVRKTASWQLYCQQFGRVLRPMLTDDQADAWGFLSDAERLEHIANSKKPRALVIDHVGNCIYHGWPDSPQEYDIGPSQRRARGSFTMPLRSCEYCTKPYERVLISCPYCGGTPEPAGRTLPEHVDGDMILLDADALRALRGEMGKVDRLFFPKDAGASLRDIIRRNHEARKGIIESLRAAMALWGGWRESLGESTREAHKRFYLTFGVDVMTAQTLDRETAGALESKIRAALSKHNVIEAT